MKSIHALALSFVLFGGTVLYAQEETTAPLACGSRLYLIVPEDSTIRIDGRTIARGSALLDLSGQTSGTIECTNKTGIARIPFAVQYGQRDIVWHRPDFSPLPPRLFIEGMDASSIVLVDGVPANLRPDGTVDLEAGSREITIKSDTFVTIRKTIVVEEGQTAQLAASGETGVPLRLAGMGERDVEIMALDADGRVISTSRQSEGFLYPAVEASFIITSLDDNARAIIRLNPESTAARPHDLAALFDTVQTPVKALPKKLAIFANGSANPIERKGLKEIPLQTGIIRIDFSIDERPAGRELVLASAGTPPVLAAGYQPPMNILSYRAKGPTIAKSRSLSTTFLLAGASILASSILANSDEFLASLTDDYATYTTYKYASLGGMGFGTLLLGSSYMFSLFE